MLRICIYVTSWHSCVRGPDHWGQKYVCTWLSEPWHCRQHVCTWLNVQSLSLTPDNTCVYLTQWTLTLQATWVYVT